MKTVPYLVIGFHALQGDLRPKSHKKTPYGIIFPRFIDAPLPAPYIKALRKGS